ncbi:hypothetical protein [Moraxella lacunata]
MTAFGTSNRQGWQRVRHRSVRVPQMGGIKFVNHRLNLSQIGLS